MERNGPETDDHAALQAGLRVPLAIQDPTPAKGLFAVYEGVHGQAADLRHLGDPCVEDDSGGDPGHEAENMARALEEEAAVWPSSRPIRKHPHN